MILKSQRKTVITVILMFLIPVIWLTSCLRVSDCELGEGPVIEVEIPLEDFDKINLEVAGNVSLRQDTVQRVTVESNSNVIANLNTAVNPDGQWDIRFLQCMSDYETFEVTISVVDINQIILSGSGNIVSIGPLETSIMSLFIPGSGSMDLGLVADRIEASISGTGVMNLDMACEDFVAEIRGTGSIQPSGFATSQNLGIIGSGGIFGYELESETCDILISGAGSCEINVSDELNVTITGTGAVRYRGNPNITSDIRGTGTVSPG